MDKKRRYVHLEHSIAVGLFHALMVGRQSGLFLLCQKLASLPISQLNFPCRWPFGRLPGEIVIGLTVRCHNSRILLQCRSKTECVEWVMGLLSVL
jgi:hypothetical protein